MHEHVFMYLPTWPPPEAVGKIGLGGLAATFVVIISILACLGWKGASGGTRSFFTLTFKCLYSSLKIYKMHKHQIPEQARCINSSIEMH